MVAGWAELLVAGRLGELQDEEMRITTRLSTSATRLDQLASVTTLDLPFAATSLQDFAVRGRWRGGLRVCGRLRVGRAVAPDASSRSGHYPQRMKLALVILAAVLLLAGCGSAASPNAAVPTAVPPSSTMRYSSKTVSLEDVSFVNAHCGWAVGDTGYIRGGHPYLDGVVLITHDGGATWMAQKITSVGVPSAVAFVNTKDGWVMGDTQNRTAIVATTDGGAHWVEQYSGATGLVDFDFVDADHGWAVGTTDGGSLLLTMTDGGATWTKRPAPGDGPFSPVFLNARQGWIAEGVSGRRHVFATTDGGATWKKQSLTGYSDIADIAFANPRDGWAVGDNSLQDRATIFATTDGGANWTMQLTRAFPPTNGQPFHNLVSVAVVDATHVWAVGADGLILATSNGGQTWQQQSSGTAAWLGSVVFSDARHGWVVGETGDGNGNFVSSTILATTNGGASWTKQK
jgi:photosystem II stability/assembly factor-like uncharacterized protein